MVIGRAGAHIKEISALTDTRLQLADAADPFQTKERMVNISGAQGENVKAAALRVLDHLLANRSVGNFINTTPSYAPTSSHHHASHAHHLPLASQNPHQQQQHMQQQYQQYQQQQQQMNLRAGAAVQGLIPAHQYHNQPPAGPPQPQVATQMGVPDEMVGAVVGKGGVVLKGIQSSTGARIKVSQKGEFIAGTTNRSITIEGTQEQVHYAHSAIMTQLSNHQAKTPY